MIEAGINPLDYSALTDYAADLKSSRGSFLKAALRFMSAEYEHTVKAGATPENMPAVQAAVLRLEAMRETIKVK